MRITHRKSKISAARKSRVSRPIRAARTETIQYLNFSELDDKQKQQAVKWFIENGPAYEWHSDDMMFWYAKNIKEMANESERESGLTIHEDKLYWQESSQGPYPEWDLSDVFDTYDGPEFTIEFWGKSTSVEYAVTIDDEDVSIEDMPEAARDIVSTAQEFITGAWKYINEICSSFPDETWAYETLEANDYEFRVDAAGNVVSMA